VSNKKYVKSVSVSEQIPTSTPNFTRQQAPGFATAEESTARVRNQHRGNRQQPHVLQRLKNQRQHETANIIKATAPRISNNDPGPAAPAAELKRLVHHCTSYRTHPSFPTRSG
jgi:hypothetical protein